MNRSEKWFIVNKRERVCFIAARDGGELRVGLALNTILFGWRERERERKEKKKRKRIKERDKIIKGISGCSALFFHIRIELNMSP